MVLLPISRKVKVRVTGAPLFAAYRAIVRQRIFPEPP